MRSDGPRAMLHLYWAVFAACDALSGCSKKVSSRRTAAELDMGLLLGLTPSLP